MLTRPDIPTGPVFRLGVTPPPPWGGRGPSAVGRAGYIWLRPMAWRGFGNSSLTPRGSRLRAHGLPLRAHGLLTRAHRLPLRAHGLALKVHRLLPRVQNYCQQRPAALSWNNLCAMGGDPRAVRGSPRALMYNPVTLMGNPCALRANPYTLRDKFPNTHPPIWRMMNARIRILGDHPRGGHLYFFIPAL